MSWKLIFYDWGGLNAALFQLINQGTPAALSPVAWILSKLLGNYWTAPLFMLGLWAWSRVSKEAGHGIAIQHRLISFVAAFVLAVAATTLLKLFFDFPRPLAVYGDLVQVIGAAEEHYSLPSGHSTYAALIAGTLWPLVGIRLRLLLVMYVVSVGWSRLAAGMHFPADVVAGWMIGAGCMALGSLLLAGFRKMPAILPARLWYALAGLVVVADQAAKGATAYLMAYGGTLHVTPFFNLVHARNDGAAFSLLAGAGGWSRYGLIALALSVSVWLMWALCRRLSYIEAVGYCLILGGALGNVLDRTLRGAVVDFLDFHWHGLHWPAFNLADVAISAGAVCLIVASILQVRPAKAGVASG